MASSRASATVCYDGCGWTLPYLIGVTEHLQRERASTLASLDLRYAGVSSGACVALAAALEVPMPELMSELLQWAPTCRRKPWTSAAAVEDICRRIVKDDASVEALERSGRFAVGVSRLELPGRGGEAHSRKLALHALHSSACDGATASSLFESVVRSSFGGDKERLVSFLVASCSVPGLTSPADVPLLNGKYLDGALSARFFRLPWRTDATVRLSAFPGRTDADVACRVSTPLLRCFAPPGEAELLRLHELGLEDGPEVVRLLLSKTSRARVAHAEADDDDRSHEPRTRLEQRMHVVRGRRVLLPGAGHEVITGSAATPCARGVARHCRHAAPRQQRGNVSRGRGVPVLRPW